MKDRDSLPSLRLAQTPSEDEAHVWAINLEKARAFVEEGVLSEEERTKAKRFKHAVHCHQYTASHWALRTILGTYLQLPPESLRFEKSIYGKSFLNHATNPLGLSFNLAHSGPMALVAMARGAQIGVDLEQRRTDIFEPGLAERFFSDRELREFRTLPREKQVEAFFNCWTRKEAYLKAVGCGLQDEVRLVELVINPGDPPKLLTGLGPQWDTAGEWTIYDLKLPEGFTGAIVVESIGSSDPQCCQFNLLP